MLGFALAPLPVVAPVLLMFAAIVSSVPPDSEAALQAAAELVVAFYVAAVLVGLPIHLILRWKQQTSLVAYLGSTVVGAALAGGLILALQGLSSANDNPFAITMWSAAGITATLTFVAIACLCATVFWIVAIRPSRI